MSDTLSVVLGVGIPAALAMTAPAAVEHGVSGWFVTGLLLCIATLLVYSLPWAARRDQRNLTDPADWDHATQQQFLADARERGGRR